MQRSEPCVYCWLIKIHPAGRLWAASVTGDQPGQYCAAQLCPGAPRHNHRYRTISRQCLPCLSCTGTTRYATSRVCPMPSGLDRDARPLNNRKRFSRKSIAILTSTPTRMATCLCRPSASTSRLALSVLQNIYRRRGSAPAGSEEANDNKAGLEQLYISFQSPCSRIGLYPHVCR